MFAENVYAICKERGITIMALEKSAGVGNGTIGKWANRGNTPTLENAKKVADALGVSVDSLLQDKKNAPTA